MNQEAKADAGKLDLTLVPRQIIWDIGEVRRFGVEKYTDPDNWKRVEKERYRAAAMRHFLAYLDDPDSKDPESGLSHLSHLACNIAFLCEMEHRGGTMVKEMNLVNPSLKGKYVFIGDDGACYIVEDYKDE